MNYIILLFCILNAWTLYAVDSLTVNKEVLFRGGVSINPSLYMHSADFAGLPDIPTCGPAYSGASGFSGSLGLDFMYDIESMPLFFHSRIDIKGIPGNFSQTEEILIDDPNANPSFQTATLGYALETSFYSLGLSLLANYTIDDRIFVGGGLRFGLLMSPTFEQREQLLSPSNAFFIPQNTRTRNEYSGIIPGFSGFETSLVLNAGYSFPMNKTNTMQLIPQLGYELPLLNVLSTSDSWKVHTLRFGLTIGFSYTTEDDVPIEIELNKPTNIPQIAITKPVKPKEKVTENLSSRLESPLSVAIFDKQGNKVENKLDVEKKVARNMFSMINYIFFDSGSVSIPERYKRISQEEQRKFSVDDMQADSALQLYHNMLNILGKRLQSSPQSTIILTGTNSNNGIEAENLQMSQQRAEVVRDYLVNVWEIDNNRIQVKSRNLPEEPSRTSTGYGDEENRRVEITSDNPDIFLPVKFIDTSFNIVNKDIRIGTERINKDNLQRWELRAFAGGKSAVLQSGQTMADTLQIDISPISFAISKSNKLELKLMSIDAEGNVRLLGENTIPITQTVANKNRVEKYNLITFGYNSTAVNDANNYIIEDVKKNILPTSTLTLTGHTDRTGNPQYNKDLSLKRAKEISRFFTANQMVTEGRGFDDLLFPLELPEGRFYSRTVRIIVDTYIDDVKE
ncbi:MAG: OmpA family protein [Candidatus Kapaibacteriota bacterium]